MDLQNKVELFVKKIRHHLISNIGKRAKDATIEEFYYAFCIALREEVMVNWTSGLETFETKKARTAYYLSMEYLPGRFLGNNITNIGASELVQHVLEKFDRNYFDLQACESDPGLGNGGLGRLAACFMDSLATQQYPAFGYGLRYQYGIFEQEVWDGFQVERPDCWLLNQNPWEFRKDADSVGLQFSGTPSSAKNSHGDEVILLDDYDEIRALPYDIPIIGYPSNHIFPVISLRLWSTKESPRNFELQRYNAGQLDQAAENMSLTDVLYPSDHHETGKRIRLKQEFLLSAASINDIIRRHMRVHEDIRLLADKARLQINDTHPTLVVAELMRVLIENYDLPWGEAWEIVQSCCSYTNHTILKEALEEWNEERVAELLPRQYNIIQRLNQDFCSKVRSKFPNDEEKVKRMSIIENGQIRMAHLAIYASHKVNGVADLHSNIIKNVVFNDFHQMMPNKFINVTNGVTPRRWLVHCNPFLTNFIKGKIGDHWITHFPELEKIQQCAADPTAQEKFLEIKRQNKRELLNFLSQENPTRDSKGKIISHSHVLDENALFDVQIKRIHEYKRQLMNALHAIMLIHDLKRDPNSRKINRMIIIGGKAAPGYQAAKNIITLIYAISRTIKNDPVLSKRLSVCFVENYNVSHAQVIIPAADLSQQISTAGKEASGTGNMKLAMNGALTIGTHDGANIEMHAAATDAWWPFGFGLSADEVAEYRCKGTYCSEEIYNQDIQIKAAVDALIDGSIATNEAEKKAFLALYNALLKDIAGSKADPYFVLKDLRAYYDTQKKVEDLYIEPQRWAEAAIHNIAAMGRFSTDTAIDKYSREIWGLEKCPADPDIVKRTEEEYSQIKGF